MVFLFSAILLESCTVSIEGGIEGTVWTGSLSLSVGTGELLVGEL